MWPTLIVVGYVGVQHGSQFSGRTDFIDVDPFILQGAEELFRSGIVQALALAVHTDPDFVFLQQRYIVRVGEMPALIAVDDFRLATRQGTLKTIDDKGLLQRGRQLVIHNIPTVPVDDDKQVHETFLHRYVRDVHAPYLVGPLDRQMTQQVRSDVLRMVSLAQVRLRVQGVDAHFPHHSACPLAIDDKPVIPPQHPGDRPIAPGGFGGMDPVDPTADLQFLVVHRLGRPLAIHTGPGNVQKFGLALDRQLWMVPLHQLRGLACVVGFVFPDLFFSTSRPHTSTALPCVPDRPHVGVPAPIPSRLQRVSF